MDALTHVAAVLAALFVWWFSTGAILLANRLPEATWGWSAALASLVLMISSAGVVLVRDDTSVLGAYGGFLCAIGIWGWHELMFLTGRITGPRTTPLPPGRAGVSRLRAATEVVLYHEVALVLTLGLIAVLSLGHVNTVALATFAVLWVMRLSAKLNVFLGVRNLSEEFLPDRMAYMATYFRRRRMNPLLPFCVFAALVAAVHILSPAWEPGATEFAVVASTLIGTLLLLAVLEHLFLVAPVALDKLWRWANDHAPKFDDTSSRW